MHNCQIDLNETAGSRRQIGVDLVDGLAVEPRFRHAFVVATRKQTSDTRTAAPSITHGSSLHASKIRRVSVAA